MNEPKGIFPVESLEEFWAYVNDIRKKKNLTWTNLAGSNSKSAAQGKWNVTLKKLFELQEILGVSLLHKLPVELLLSEPVQEIQRNPKAKEIMKEVHTLIASESWMTDEELIKEVQQLTKELK